MVTWMKFLESNPEIAEQKALHTAERLLPQFAVMWATGLTNPKGPSTNIIGALAFYI